jgi:Na+-transporting methylmalonyl-CoA/oxaloacetate decarboxylase gamma subunit
MSNFILNTLFFVGIVLLLWVFVIVMMGFMSYMVIRLLINEVKHEKMG